MYNSVVHNNRKEGTIHISVNWWITYTSRVLFSSESNELINVPTALVNLKNIIVSEKSQIQDTVLFDSICIKGKFIKEIG